MASPAVAAAPVAVEAALHSRTAAARVTPGPAARTATPNILVIYTDDQTPRSLSCYEGAPPWVATPDIDRLAAEGLRFAHCYGAP